jgi:histidine triad (HIT) family protein
MQDCVLCKIWRQELLSKKIWGDDEFVAVLDLFPRIEGQVLLFPKKHVDSYILKLPQDFQSRFLAAAAKVASLMDQRLGCSRTALIMEGLELVHAHIKLFPVYNIDDYISGVAKPGSKADEKMLEKLQKKFL